jgi:hypothetical protein
LHDQKITLKNISAKHISIKEINGKIIPVFVNFGQCQLFDNKENKFENDEEEVRRYKKHLLENSGKSPEYEFKLSLENLPKSDITAYSNLLLRTFETYNPLEHANSKLDFNEYVKKF